MREIKFRAWDKAGKQMLLSESPLFLQSFLEEMWLAVGAIHPVQYPQYDYDNYELMQYTGLKDESFSKVEIYEGDLFGKSDSNGIEAYGEVYFDTDFAGFCVKYPNGGWTTLGEHLLNKQNHREVIGNIYENPDLTTVSKKGADDE